MKPKPTLNDPKRPKNAKKAPKIKKIPLLEIAHFHGEEKKVWKNKFDFRKAEWIIFPHAFVRFEVGAQDYRRKRPSRRPFFDFFKRNIALLPPLADLGQGETRKNDIVMLQTEQYSNGKSSLRQIWDTTVRITVEMTKYGQNCQKIA